MAAVKSDIILEQGTSWSLTVSLKKPNTLPLDLTGYTVKCQMRKTYQDATPFAEPTCVILHPSTDGKFSLSLTKEQTTALNFNTGVYDIIMLSPAGKVSRIIQGNVKFSPQVTKLS